MKKKFQVTIKFSWTDDFAEKIPPHRTYIDSLIEDEIIDYYAVSMEARKVWITMNAINKEEIINILKKSPLYEYWLFEIDELFVFDGQSYRMPSVQLN